MNFLRKHWYDAGGILAIITLLFTGIFRSILSDYQILMWLSLVSLFFHQLEEYRIVGTFPGMINRVMFKSNLPNRYPLNTNTSLIINTGTGWSIYFLAALFAENAIWLGIAAILISVGNIFAHTIVFNVKGKSFYNAGMATAIFLFIPCVCFFFLIVGNEHLATTTDYLIGIPLGVVLNIFGIFKLISWLANKNTKYIFEKRNLLPADR